MVYNLSRFLQFPARSEVNNPGQINSMSTGCINLKDKSIHNSQSIRQIFIEISICFKPSMVSNLIIFRLIPHPSFLCLSFCKRHLRTVLGSNDKLPQAADLLRLRFLQILRNFDYLMVPRINLKKPFCRNFVNSYYMNHTSKK